MDSEKKEYGAWWVWILTLTVLSIIVFTGLSYLGVVGGTIVERKVFENSFQYSEARKTEIATYEAQISEIEGQLTNSQLEEGTRINLKAQLSSINILLKVARSKTN